VQINKILLVDDEKHVRRIAEIHLSAVPGWSVTVATSGAEALEKAQSDKPDLILLDLRMPGMDGLATLKNLRNNPETAGIAVILLTAAETNEELEDTRSLNLVGIIIKRDPSTLPSQVLALTEKL
jgi:CheY-like chemotaxis protein